jgi:hypothetical protein
MQFIHPQSFEFLFKRLNTTDSDVISRNVSDEKSVSYQSSKISPFGRNDKDLN